MRQPALDKKLRESLHEAERLLTEGKFEDVRNRCLEILKNSPKSAKANYLIGASHLIERHFDDAEKYLKRSNKFFANDPTTVLALSRCYTDQNKFEQAESLLKSNVELTSASKRLANELIQSLMQQPKLEEALLLVDELLQLHARDADLFNKRGYILQQFGKQAEATANFSCAIIHNPDFAEAYNNRANSLKAMGQFQEAIADYEKTIYLQPKHALAHSNMSLSLLELGHCQEALEACERSIEMNSDYPGAHNNKGMALQKLGEFEKSIEAFETALNLSPKFAIAHNNLGFSQQQLEDWDSATQSYKTALEIEPNYPEARWNLGLHELLLGNLESGWSNFEWRWMGKGQSKRPGVLGIPIWEGQSPERKSIAVFAEQGYGDTFQFIRYLKILCDQDAMVTFVVPKALHRVLKAMDPRVHLTESLDKHTPYDFQCPLLSLPERLKTTLNSIPNFTPYLFAEQNLMDSWKLQFDPKAFNVGISWQGNPEGIVDFERSLPLAKLLPLAELDGVNLISLQYQHGLDQLENDRPRTSVKVLNDFNAGEDAFVDSAAVMKCMDLIISSDSAPVHLAGALGVPVWTLLKRVPDWRWMIDRNDSPWYPSMRLYRQQVRNDWSDVISEVRADLQSLAAAKIGGKD